MANKRNTKVILLIRDPAEDDLLTEIWKTISQLRISYLRHVYTRCQRSKKPNAKPSVVTGPKISSAGQQQNFSVKSNIGVGGGSIPTEVPKAPTDIITSVVREAPKPLPPSQPITTTVTTKVSSPPVSKPMSVTNLPKAPSPPPVKVPSPPLVNCFEPGRPTDPPKIVTPSPPVEEPREKVKRSWSSLVVKNSTTEKPKLIRTDSDSVKVWVPESPPLLQVPIPVPQESKPSRRVEKARQDPKRLQWIDRREKLEECGADLSNVSVGRKDVECWDDLTVRGTWHGKNLYVVWSGVKVGCFVGWDRTNTLVKGYKGAGYKKVSSEAEAVEALEKYLL